MGQGRRARLLIAALLLALLAACAPQLQPPGPGGDGPAFVLAPSGRGHFVTADGLELPLRSWEPAGGEARAAVLALHGFNDYSNAFEIPAPRLARQGLRVYAYDQRGFGLAPYPGRWAGIARLAGDARDAVRLVARRHPGLPVYLLGESMGAAVALVALAGDLRPDAVGERLGPPAAPLPVAGVILSAPAFWSRDAMPALYRTLLHAAAHTVPWYPLTGEGLRIQASDNLAVLLGLARDPFVIKHTRVDAIWGLVDLMDAAVAAAPAIDCPVLLLYGQKDQVVPPAPVLRTIERLPPEAAGRWHVAIYPDGYHLLLRDLQGERVSADVAAWIADRKTPLPSGADRQAMARLRAHAAGEPEPAVETFAPDRALR